MSETDAFRVQGAVAVVTGGAGGIGRALAERLTSEGARVAIVDLASAAPEETAATLDGAIGIGTDVGDEAAVQAMVAQVEADLGPIDLYLSNAGIGGGRELGDDEAWRRSWQVHGMAHIYAARAVLPGMAARRSGAMVITASAAGLLMMMQSAPYTVTKHASVAIAEWLAVEYGDQGVHLHCLCPQGVRTPMVSADSSGEAEVAASGRLLEPAEVADAVLAALRSNQFLILPHPEVHGYEQGKVSDRTRWLATMTRLKRRITG
ncbi:MAG: SDR family oxidoreductase [Actinomycetota bacterium]|nr:SDR family oxidoreductase [Actinomycetota bacterium]